MHQVGGVYLHGDCRGEAAISSQSPEHGEEENPSELGNFIGSEGDSVGEGNRSVADALTQSRRGPPSCGSGALSHNRE
jgi:hypothetical protein